MNNKNGFRRPNKRSSNNTAPITREQAILREKNRAESLRRRSERKEFTGAVMVNDDKPFLRLTENGVLAYGSPWNGKHRLGNNICVPLKAICILERGDENIIRPISGQEASMMLFQQSNRPMDPRKMPIYMDLIDRLSKQTAFYRMQCTLDPEAARVAYETMSK